MRARMSGSAASMRCAMTAWDRFCIGPPDSESYAMLSREGIPKSELGALSGALRRGFDLDAGLISLPNGSRNADR
jgi:hypothetical protein